jgi:hypothetical protein
MEIKEKRNVGKSEGCKRRNSENSVTVFCGNVSRSINL